MLNRHRERALPRLTADPTATSSAYLLTLQFLWQMHAIMQEKAQLEQHLRQVRTRIATCFTTLISYQDCHMFCLSR